MAVTTLQRVTRRNNVNACVADEWTATMRRSKANAKRWKGWATRMAQAVIDGDVDRAMELAEEVMGCQN